MKCFINDDLALSRPPEGPVASYIVPFAEWLGDRGYGLSMRNQVLLAAGFSKWLGQKGIELSDISGDHPGRYLLDRAQRPKLGDTAALRHLLAFLRSQNAIAEEIEAEYNPSPVEQHVQAYERYLHHARALSGQTIINYRPVVRDFLNFRFGGGEVSLAQLRAVDVTDFVQRKVSRLNMRRAKIITTALRSFLSYVRYRGDVTSDLAAAVPIVANWSLSSIPRAIGRDEVTRLLASINRDTPVGCRDYAMILALARLGLRSSEVVARTRRYRLGRRADPCAWQERSTQRPSVASGCWRGDCRLPAEGAPTQCRPSRLLARQGPDPRFQGAEWVRVGHPTLTQEGWHRISHKGNAPVPTRPCLRDAAWRCLAG